MSDAETDMIRQTAEQFTLLIEAQTGSRLDFDVDSLAQLDALLSQWLDLASVYGEGDEAFLDQLVVPVASYVGEVLSRSIGAEWDEASSEGARLPVLRLPDARRLDLEEAVSAVVHGLSGPAFHRLAVELSQNRAVLAAES